jgi:hypothetical protein
MPLSMRIAKPNPGRRTSCIASNARPAVFSSGSIGSCPANPLMSVMVTPGCSVRLTVTRSPSAPTENPRISKPIATLATEAGANAVAQRGGSVADVVLDMSGALTYPFGGHCQGNRRTRFSLPIGAIVRPKISNPGPEARKSAGFPVQL